MTAKEQIQKYCQVVKEPGRRGDVLIYGRHKYRMSRLLVNLTEEEAAKVFKVMELQAHIDKLKSRAEKTGRKAVVKAEAKPCECGCKAMAKPGRKFRPGHDAKLKSQLREAAGNGDKEAQAELKRRDW